MKDATAAILTQAGELLRWHDKYSYTSPINVIEDNLHAFIFVVLFDEFLDPVNCYNLPLTTLSHFYDNFSFHVSLSRDSTYASL